MANVQCQYDSPSDEDADRPRPQPSARPPDDHTYDLRDEPPAFIIQNSLQSQHLQITQSSSGTLEVAPKIMHHSFNVIQVGDRPYPQVSPQPEYNLNKRIRRSEVVLRQAADCVSRGSTFQTVSEQFNIPISTIRFFMARKGILPRRRRGRTTQTRVCNSPEPPFHMQHFKLPSMMALHDIDEEQN